MTNRLSNFNSKPEDQMVFSIRSTWAGLVADLSFQSGDQFVEVDTAPSAQIPAIDGSWCQVSGRSPTGRFSVFLPVSLLASLIDGIDEKLKLENLDCNTAAVLLEHALTPSLTKLENVLGSDLTLLEVSELRRAVTENLLGLVFNVNETTIHGALMVDGDLADRLEYVVQENSSAEEKNIDPTLVVHLGPVVLPTRDACLASTGSTIDCGVMPTEIIKGVLMRSDNRYWPIHIEDDAVEIAGELSAPVDFSRSGDENVFVTFALGQVELKPVERKNLQPGQKLQVERYPDNGARVHYQTVPYAEGSIVLLGDNLAVQLASLEISPQSNISSNLTSEITGNMNV